MQLEIRHEMVYKSLPTRQRCSGHCQIVLVDAVPSTRIIRLSAREVAMVCHQGPAPSKRAVFGAALMLRVHFGPPGSPPAVAPGALCPLSVLGGDVGAVTVVSAVAGRLPFSPAPSLTQVTPQQAHHGGDEQMFGAK
jgi:hypothetical protein